jgi:hypothetical protein
MEVIMPQVTILLKPSEKDALILLADQERRRLQDQAALIVVSELQRRGLIESITTENKNDIREVPNGKSR